jgi:TolA-binding protein
MASWMLLPTRWRRDDARVSKVRVILGALVVLLLVAACAAGCGPDSDQGQAPQEATKKIEGKGQQARQTVKKKVEAKKQELKKHVEALQKEVDDLQKEVQDLQNKTLSENLTMNLEQRRISPRMGLPTFTICKADAPNERGYHNQEGGLL